MKQEFTLKKDEYYKTRKRIVYTILGFSAYFIVLMWGIFYFTGTKIPMPSRWIDVYFLFLFVLMTLFPFLDELSKARAAYKTYRIIFDNHAIKLKKLGTWNSLPQKLFFFKPRYIIDKRQIFRKF